MKSNTELLAIAKKQLGNGGKIYRNYVHASGNYCNMFVFWLYDANGCGDLFALPKTNYYRTYCPDSIKWCKKNLAQIPPYLAMASDIIYFDWDKNGAPNHIGIVEKKVSTKGVETIEGNTTLVKNKKVVASGVVAEKGRNTGYTYIFRPKFKPKTVKLCKLETETGDFGYVSVANLQRALGLTPNGVLDKQTVKTLQKKAGTTADGAWGNGTSKAVQKLIGVTADGEFGKKSVIALKKWINKQNNAEPKPVEKPKEPTPAVPKKTKAEKLVASAKRLAWKKGTPKKKYAYGTGKPTDAMKKAMNKRGYDSKVEYSDCGYCQNTVIYDALGTMTKVLGSVKADFPKVSGFDVVWEGKKIVSGVLKPADIIRYKKRKRKSHHTLMYLGNNDFSEGGRKIRFFVIRHFDKLSKAKFNKSNVDIDTLQVLRAKE